MEYIFIRLPKINRIYLFIDEHFKLIRIIKLMKVMKVDRSTIHRKWEKKNKSILLKNNTKNKQTTCR